MTQVKINVPDDKYSFFVELMENLGFELDEDIDIPEEHKEIVRERIQLSKNDPDRLLDWEQVKDSFDLDS